MKDSTILVVEDEAITAMDIQHRLEKLGYKATATIASGEEAIVLAGTIHPSLILMDIVLKGKMDGTDAAQQITGLYNIPIIFLTAYNDEDTFDRARLSGPYGYLTKPFETRDLHNAIELALFKHSTEAKMVAAQKRYRSIMENASCGIFVFDHNGIISDINKKTEVIFGSDRENIIGKNFKDFIETSNKIYAGVQLQKLLVEKTIGPYEEHIQNPNGDIRDIEFTAIYVDEGDEKFMFSILNDITEAKKLRSQTLLADKLATVGVLAAGIIHEINNPMTWILNNLDYLRMKVKLLKAGEEDPVELLPKLEEVISETRQGAERITEIVRELKGFGRIDDEDVTLFNVHDTLNFAINMAQPQYKNHARLEAEFADDLPQVFLSNNQLQQVFLNLILNASQAMDMDNINSNLIKIKTRVQKNRIRIDIIDTGKGIEPHDLAKIFEPFFTTKPAGIGTGIGLSICYDIIHSLGGEIKVESIVGKGSTFSVYLPYQLTIAPSTDVIGSFKHKKILVIDDEPMILSAIKQALEQYHEVTTCNARSALKLLTKADNNFEVIVTDIHMPDVNGMDLYQFVDRNNHNLIKHMIFMTANRDSPKTKEFLKSVNNPCLEKPFTPDQLLQVIDNTFS
ncbi:MAG: response regulator [Pseudomonadota bacterium]